MALLAALFRIGPVLAQPVQKHLSFQDIISTAEDRVRKPFEGPTGHLPEELQGDKLNYDTYREIRFRHEKALWTKDELPFRLEFYHPGYLYQTPVSLYEFNDAHVQPIRFVQDFFDYGKLDLPKKIPADTGYAGFKVLYRLNAPDHWDELASFLGASYFRCLAKDQRYGSSARGLALNSGEPDLVEEFPLFTRWWLGKPEKGSRTLHLYALLESASCAGAYDFLLRPGESTFVDVEAVVYLRETTSRTNLRTFGQAPLTSMFWFGENAESRTDDYRPEVHDSDGLAIRFEDDRFLWCPLKNPFALEHRTFTTRNPRGFGLLQRDRKAVDYQDLFNLYQRVPSVWVEPRGDWGAGAVHLVQLPTQGEGFDNIVAFWDPASKPEPGQPYRFAYTLHWAMEPEAKIPLSRVMQTRVGANSRDGSKRQFAIDFSEAKLDSAPGGMPQVEVQCGEDAAVSDTQIFRNEISKGWRVFFSLKPDAAKGGPVNIQCWLKRGTNVLSENWSYLWNPLPRTPSLK